MKISNLISFIKQLEYDVLIKVKPQLLKTQIDIIDFESFEKFLNSFKKIIEDDKINISDRSHSRSSRMNPNRLTAEQFLEFYNTVEFDDELYNSLRSRYTNLISFEFPVLELFPGKGTFTTEAVAGEPLYIADYYMENLEKVGSLFNDFFNERRLMKYQIKDFDLSNLPQNQFGLVFSYSYFMVKDIDFIANWAEETFKVLRPGGYFIFNFIPDDTFDGLNLSENHGLSAVNHNQLVDRLIAMGYEFLKKDIMNSYGSTILVKKPGEMTPFKLTANMAKYIEKTAPLV